MCQFVECEVGYYYQEIVGLQCIGLFFWLDGGGGFQEELVFVFLCVFLQEGFYWCFGGFGDGYYVVLVFGLFGWMVVQCVGYFYVDWCYDVD